MADDLGVEGLEARRTFVRGFKPTTQALLSRSTVLVAAPRKDPDTVLGWICFEKPNTLHFVFVKKDFRQARVATRLVEAAGLAPKSCCSHATFWGTPRVARLFESLTHIPELGVLPS